jgi:TRAP-type C4-dicarboxylate transport system permease small subunit
MSAPSSEDDATAALFRQWEEEERATSLADLRWDDAVVFLLFWALFGTVFLQFYTRYVLNDALGWTEEIARYLLIGVCFVGSVMAVRKGSHITVEALLIMLPERARAHALTAVEALMVAFTGFMTWHSVRLSLLTRQYMASVDVPKSVIYWVVAASFAAMTLYALLRLVRRLRGRAVEHHGVILD